MSSLVSCIIAVGTTALIALAPVSARADTSLVGPRLASAAWHGPLAALKLQIKTIKGTAVPFTLPVLTTHRLPPSLAPSAAASWTLHDRALPLQLELNQLRPPRDSVQTVDLLAGLKLPSSVPPLIRYTDETNDTNVTLSISPGSPCTAACLKVAGSF